MITRKIWHLMQSNYLRVIALIILYLCFRNNIGLEAKSIIITVGSVIKTAFLIFVPVAAMFFIAFSITSFASHAVGFIFLVLIVEGISNFVVVWYAYFCSIGVAGILPNLSRVAISDNISDVYKFAIAIPSWWSTTIFIPLGLALGIVYSLTYRVINMDGYANMIARLKSGMQTFILRFLGPLVPLLIFCQIVILDQKNLISYAIDHYLYFALFYIGMAILYIFLLFFVNCGFSFSKAVQSIRNIFPAIGFAFTSSCSISTMPINIQHTGKNLKNKTLAEFIIPATTNIQQIGDCMFQALLCSFVYYQFNGFLPNVSMWSIFVIHFVVARYTTSAILGGSIFIMLPIYQRSFSNNNCDI